MASQQILQLGILLPTRGVFLKSKSSPDLSSLFALAEHAENADLDSIWVGDSLTAKPRLEPLSTLAAIAMRTHKIKLGTAVLLAPLRRPVQLAQTAATVDLLSNGRLTLGMGVGGVFTESQRQEWFAAEVPIDHRGARMTELVQVCRQLWTEDNFTFTGKYFQLEQTTLEPKPTQPEGIPMLLACHYATGSKAQYRRASVYGDGIIGISDTPAQYAETLQLVRDIAVEAGRNPDVLRAAFYMTVNLNRDRYAAWQEADAFIRSYYGLNVWADKWGPFGPPEHTIQRIIEYSRAGATEIIVRFASPDQLSQLDIFTKEVIPGVMERLSA